MVGHIEIEAINYSTEYPKGRILDLENLSDESLADIKNQAQEIIDTIEQRNNRGDSGDDEKDDVEDMTIDNLGDEFLKIVDELQTRGYGFEDLNKLMRNGSRNR